MTALRAKEATPCWSESWALLLKSRGCIILHWDVYEAVPAVLLCSAFVGGVLDIGRLCLAVVVVLRTGGRGGGDAE